MFRLLASFFYRLRRDLTFRITSIIGLALSIGLPLLYFALDLTIFIISKQESGGADVEFMHLLCNGQSLFVGSFSPLQNFGIAIPINLVSFIVLEFSHGTVRNKIISGHSKLSVFLATVLSTVILSLLWIGAYVGISTGLGSLLGFAGFDPNGVAYMSGQVSPEYLIKLGILALFCYVLIACIATFFATLFRNIGPSIAVVLLMIAGLYLGATLIGLPSAIWVNDITLLDPLSIHSPSSVSRYR